MATTAEYFEFAQLAQAAYGDFSDITYGRQDFLLAVLTDADKNANFTVKQAEIFTDPVMGYTLRDHTPNDLLDGFSASLFESNAHPGEFTLALRGTEPTDLRDWASDADIATSGLARDHDPKGSASSFFLRGRHATPPTH